MGEEKYKIENIHEMPTRIKYPVSCFADHINENDFPCQTQYHIYKKHKSETKDCEWNIWGYNDYHEDDFYIIEVINPRLQKATRVIYKLEHKEKSKHRKCKIF